MTIFDIIGFSLMFLPVVFFVLAALPDKWNIVTKLVERKEKIEAKKNPDYMAALIKINEEAQSCVYLGELVNETKRKVDTLLVKINYAPLDKKPELIEQCEEAKKLLFDYEENYQVAWKELTNKREELNKKRKELGLRWN